MPQFELLPAPILAYIGPGGLTAFWAVVGLAVTLGSALIAVILWPLRRLRRKMRATASGLEGSAEQAEEVAMRSGDT